MDVTNRIPPWESAPTAGVDGDVLVYRSGFAAQHTVYEVFSVDPQWQGIALAEFPYKADAVAWVGDDPDLTIVPRIDVEPEGLAKYNFRSIFEKILWQTKAPRYKLYLTGPGNFRDHMATLKVYKGNRDPEAKPKHYAVLKEFATKQYGAITIDGQEADDALGIDGIKAFKEWETSGRLPGQSKYVLCTVDKDLQMIPGLHYNFVKDELHWIDRRDALRFFYWQLLVGDSTDNIGGCPKIGKKRAEAALEGKDDEMAMWLACRDLYAKHYEDVEAVMVENARLLWIRRKPDEMWVPPTERDYTYLESEEDNNGDYNRTP